VSDGTPFSLLGWEDLLPHDHRGGTRRLDGVDFEIRRLSLADGDLAELGVTLAGRTSAPLVATHRWEPRELPPLTAPTANTRHVSPLGTAWREITQRDTPAAIVCNGARGIGRLAVLGAVEDLRRVARALAAWTRWDAELAEWIDHLPDAEPYLDDDLAPAVRIAPDDAKVGVRGGSAMVVRLQGVEIPRDGRLPEVTARHAARAGAQVYFGHGGAEVFWPTIVRDRDKIAAALAALRSLRAAANSPYR
jgi:hypothetical protein